MSTVTVSEITAVFEREIGEKQMKMEADVFPVKKVFNRILGN